MNNINLDDQFEDFIKKLEGSKPIPIQTRMTIKNSFFSGAGYLLKALTDIKSKKIDISFETLSELINEYETYFKNLRSSELN